MLSRRRLLVLALLGPFALGGCAHLPRTGLLQSHPRHLAKPNIAHTLEKAGVAKLRAGDYKDASRIFNAGLKFDPTSADLNFLNGLTYQLRYLRGNQAMLGLATVGYELALRYNPAHYYAALQLGRLQFDARRYNKAAMAFHRALEIRPDSGAACLGLASADYYLHKLRRARVAADKAASLMPHSAAVARAQAMIYAALGAPLKAHAASVRYAKLEANTFDRTKVDRRLHDWRAWYASFPARSAVGVSAHTSTLVAQVQSSPGSSSGAATGSSPSAPSSLSAGKPSSSTPTGSSPGANNGLPTVFSPRSNASARTGQAQQRSPRRPWYDCSGSGGDQSVGSQYGSSYSSSYGSGGDAAPLPALPSPCANGRTPRMVILDVVFIQTENNDSTSYGINVLQGLNAVFGITRVGTRTETPGLSAAAARGFGVTGPSNIITVTRQAGLGGAAFGSQVAYSLNIVNSTGDQTKVLSNPSLIALDRMPSTFFSGANLTVGIVGGAGSSSSIQNQKVGTSLSVTPTFIGKNKLLLALRAGRSFLSPVDLNVDFQQAYQTTRNILSADVALKMGQTVILSGLSEKVQERISDGVPVLKDIPGVQYLFNNSTTETFTKSVLVLITPRPAEAGRAMMRQMMPSISALSGPQRRYTQLIQKRMRTSPDSIPDNLPSTYAHVGDNTMFLQFRTGDLRLQRWHDPSRLSRFFKQLGNALYYSNELE